MDGRRTETKKFPAISYAEWYVLGLFLGFVVEFLTGGADE